MKSTVSHTSRNLLFHLLSVDGERAVGSPNLSVSVGALADGLEALLSGGLRPASLEDYIRGSAPGPDCFTVSFDDAHPSLLEHAAPALAELGVPATVFVPTDSVGQTDRVMGWQEIQALAALPGWTVGSHGAAHVRMGWRLYREGTEAHLERLLDSARRSQRAIAERLGSRPLLFAYPFGEAPAAAREAVRRAGYRAAFTVASTQDWDGDPMGIPRLDGVMALASRDVGAELGDDPPGISVVVPAFDRVEILKEVVRRLADQSYPPERHEVIVVDDGSRADLRRELSAWLGDRIRVLVLEGADASFRAGQARQAGADAARFEVLAFLDADVAVDQDFLWHLAYCHELDSSAVVLGYLSGYNLHDLGQVHGLGEISAAERLAGDVVPVIPDRSREPSLRECLDDVQGLAEPWRLAYTGNISVSRSMLDRAGGFCQDFHGWGFEDVDLGVRLHEAGASWIFSRWALGYHLADETESPGRGAPRNPFRDARPSRERFVGALENLSRLEARHEGHAGVASFCAQVRADIDEICDPPNTLGVEVGAGSPFEWPFERRLHQPAPGGLPLEEILDRLAYASKLGVRSLYFVGGDVALRRDLPRILDVARDHGVTDMTIETTAMTLGATGAASTLASRGLSAAVVEVLAGEGHPRCDEAVAEGVAALRSAGVRLGAKLVLGADDRAAFDRAMTWIRSLELALYSVVLLDPVAETWVRTMVDSEVEVEVVGISL